MGLFGFGRSSTLFWPGCYSFALLADKVGNYERILKKLKIGFSLADENICCAGILVNAGYDKEARKLARENLDFLRKNGAKKIITSCPLCYKTLSQDYPKFLPDWDIETEFILTAILNKIKQNPDYIKQKENLVENKIVYYDSCYLGRYCKIYDEPREILDILGYEVVELPYSREESLCCGSCGNLPLTNKELADKIARDFIKQLKRTGINKIVTADAQAYLHLKQNLEGSGIRVLEFSDVLGDVLP